MTLFAADEIEAIVRRNVGVVVRPDFQIDAIGDGHAELRLPFVPGMTRLGDTVSGPVLMTAADAAMYAAIIAHVPDGEFAVTSYMHIDFLRRPGTADLRARATLLRVGRRSVTCRVEIFSGDAEDVVAHVTGGYVRMAHATSGV